MMFGPSDKLGAETMRLVVPLTLTGINSVVCAEAGSWPKLQ